jgi:hypothetical protein
MWFARTLVVVGMFGLAACGSESFVDACEDACENPCEGDTVDDDCAANCDAAQALNEASSCGDEADDAACGVNACSEDDVDQECATSVFAYLSCITTYCEDHPNDPNCSGAL